MKIGKLRLNFNTGIFPAWFEGMVFAALCLAYIGICVIKYNWDAVTWCHMHGSPDWLLPLVAYADLVVVVVNVGMGCVGMVVSLMAAICWHITPREEQDEFRSMTRWGFLFINPLGLYFCVIALYCGIL